MTITHPHPPSGGTSKGLFGLAGVAAWLSCPSSLVLVSFSLAMFRLEQWLSGHCLTSKNFYDLIHTAIEQSLPAYTGDVVEQRWPACGLILAGLR